MYDKFPSSLGKLPVKYSFKKKAHQLWARVINDVVRVSIPQNYAHFDFFSFFKKIENWILSRDISVLPLITFESGQRVCIFGKDYEVIHIQGISNRIVLEEGRFLIVRAKPSVCTITLVVKFLKKILQMKVENKSLEYAQKIGVTISKISVRKMTSRWGSCSSSGNLSYALNLVFAPESMVDYVCAHEVSHLIHMNHGKDFWDCTQKLYPEVKVARKWFKENRRSLFCYQLTPRF